MPHLSYAPTASPLIHSVDTGDFVVLELSSDVGSAALSSLYPNKAEWELLKQGTRGVLEKLAAEKTLSFRSYQLCIWQERYVFADDSALCYQHLDGAAQPFGTPKCISYSSIEFVGPFDETQFVLKCEKRAYTFLCDSTEERTRWIKNIAALSGCSSSTEICLKSKTMGN
mmetsp:Transcript_14596/g.47677  ORF Transcript_14596/g.47677 Transcript_14596/m.47677 type:complete len:170 (-) Transcript_14596:471-980(-)